MPIITIFSAEFCQSREVAQLVSDRTEFSLLTDQDIVSKAVSLSGEPHEKIQQAFLANESEFNAFTFEKQKSIAFLRLALAHHLSRNPFVLEGDTSLLIPASVHHALKVCLIANSDSRKTRTGKALGIDEFEASKIISNENKNKAAWTECCHGITDPWDASLYDIVLPMDNTSVEQAAGIILEALGGMPRYSDEEVKSINKDFELSAIVRTKLILVGHDVDVFARNGHVEIKVDKPVVMRKRLEEELKNLTRDIPGIKHVDIGFGAAGTDREIPMPEHEPHFSKILLVDDEREFVQTLSERLQMRRMESATVYDGQAALDCIEDDEPEVMIIDLKMPGIDGIEVLRRVKQTRPRIEVIVLTGHGSEQDRETCMSLGAFAYLQKPVDIDLLSKTLKAADDKIKNCR